MKVDTITGRLSGRNEKRSSQSQIEENDQEKTKRKEEKVIHSFCSFQRHVGPPEYRKWRRIHGLQLPLHPQQVAGWIFIFAVGAATFLVLIPALRPFFREGLFIVLGTLFALHIVSHLAALLLDPADPELRALKVNFTVPEFDRTKHAHVIENGRCHLCNIKTSSPKTKHCSVCNKCVDHFDHHCKWLNHCIGGRNYIAFLICVVSAVAATLVVVGVSVLEIVYYHIDPTLLAVFPNPQNGTAQEPYLPDSVFLGIVAVLGLLAATTAGLLLHLCLFHCYISVLGISTYEYIRNYRQEGNDNTQRRIITNSCYLRKKEVMSNHMETSQKSGSKTSIMFENCCYYSCSRPPEVEEEDDQGCVGTKLCFFRNKYFFKGRENQKRKPLKRQNTDPEFVDKIIKPFLITLNDERYSEVTANDSKSLRSCFQSVNERKNVEDSCAKLEDNDGPKDQGSQEKPEREKAEKTLSCNNRYSWCPRIWRQLSARNSENSAIVKTNQIRPTTAEDLNHSTEAQNVKKQIENCSQDLDLKSFMTMKTQVLPELNESLKKLKSAADLKELNKVLDLVDGPESEYVFSTKPSTRKIRRKNILNRPRSPLLSPIRESGLSNPDSPRVDLILPPTPVFARMSSPETSMIFLSNPNSSPSSSSDDGEDDIVSQPNIMINRHYRSEDILQTPQLPRKVFSAGKSEQIFVLKPSKIKASKWIDLEIKN